MTTVEQPHTDGTPVTVQAAALAWHDAGFCVLPTADDGTKRPGVGSWTRYQREQFARETLAVGQFHGIGLVCGAVSGGLEMLEAEGRAMQESALQKVAAAAAERGLDTLWRRVTLDPGAYVEMTPSGGVHILYRVTGGPVPGNTKLASRPARPDELTGTEPDLVAKGRTVVRVLAETRGEGGYVVVAPSGGPVHPTGQPWRLAIGAPGVVPTITAAEHQQLHDLMRVLDQVPQKPTTSVGQSPTEVPRPASTGLRPGEDFNQRARWVDILEPEGWQVHYEADGVTYWTRPGKGTGNSATTNHGGNDRLKVMTNSTEFKSVLDTNETYDKFGAWAVLHHGGDHSAAARNLAAQGYGAPAGSTWPLATPAAAWFTAPVTGAVAGGGEGTAVAQVDGPGTIPHPTEAMAVARTWLIGRVEDGLLTIRRWRGGWMVWERARWIERDQATIASSLWLWLEHAKYIDFADDPPKMKPWRPSVRKVNEVAAAIQAITLLGEDVNTPAWAGPDGLYEAEQDGATFVSVRNGLLDVATRQLHPHTPRFFNLVSVPFAYNPQAPTPARWLAFLAQLWPDDPESVAALQEFFGYVLSGRTDLHKILLIVGPPRGGKGTLARILTALVGKGSMAGPTLASLGQNFGMAPLLGKPLAIVSDARMGRDSREIVERLLTLSGEDTITVDRKNRDAWTGALPTRMVILSNELPTFGDASGAIATRFITLTLTNTWLGQEDVTLGHDLMLELPGILNWALDGLDRVRRTDRITEPSASREAMQALREAASPMAAFLDEKCVTGSEHLVTVDALWFAWKVWCEDNGRHPGTKQTLSRNVRSVAPHVQVVRPRDTGARQRVFAGLALTTLAWSAAGPHGPLPGPHGPHAPARVNPQVSGGAGPHGPHGPHENSNSETKTVTPLPIRECETTGFYADHADHASPPQVSALPHADHHADRVADHADQADPNLCPRCARVVPALAWLSCDRCGTRTHARGRGAHGPTCHICLTERTAS